MKSMMINEHSLEWLKETIKANIDGDDKELRYMVRGMKVALICLGLLDEEEKSPEPTKAIRA